MNPCPYNCDNKSVFGYCMYTVCINPKYTTSNMLISKRKRPITNADQIRAMNDEELAKWLGKLKHSPDCDSKCHKDFEIYGEPRIFCADCWLDWLKQEMSSNADS